MNAALYPRESWEWFGHAGHFICGRWCRFHLCTKVGPWLVSTVGEYVHPRHSAGSEQREQEWLTKNPQGEDIGYGRKYETMVFRAGTPCSNPDCKCGMPTAVSFDAVFTRGYNLAGDAREGHDDACCQFQNKLATQQETI